MWRYLSLYIIPLLQIIQIAWNLGPEMMYVQAGPSSFLFLSPCLSTTSSIWIRGTFTLWIPWVLLNKICAILMVFSLIRLICSFSFSLGQWFINFVHFVQMQTSILWVYFDYSSFILNLPVAFLFSCFVLSHYLIPSWSSSGTELIHDVSILIFIVNIHLRRYIVLAHFCRCLITYDLLYLHACYLKKYIFNAAVAFLYVISCGIYIFNFHVICFCRILFSLLNYNCTVTLWCENVVS